MSTPFVELFGDSILGPDGAGSVATAGSALGSAEVVAIYFSAHWCPPCRKFTPQLVETLAQLKDSGKSFEIVFATGDKDEKQFSEYFGEMEGFHALPYGSPAIATLNRKFKVEGIPTLVLLDGKTGKAYSTDARGDVAKDPMGNNFPWKPPTLAEALGETLVNGAGEKVKAADVMAKPFALYFSAHWCPPCRGFTPQLVETYKKVREAGKDFEIIFVSSDRSESGFAEYFGEMPWLALPYADRERKEQLSSLFKVQGIPTLVICDAGGEVINAKGRAAVSGDPQGAEFPWAPKAVNSVEEPDGINETASLIVLMEQAGGETQAELSAALDALAEARAPAKGEDRELLFFTASKAGGRVAPQIRKMAGIEGEDSATKVVLLDIPDSGGYYLMESEPTKEGLASFLADYEAGRLKGARKQLARM